MSSKKSKSRKTKRYQGQMGSDQRPGTGLLLGEWTLLNKTRDAIDQQISHYRSIASWGSQAGIFDLLNAHGDLPLLQQRLQTYAGDIDAVQLKFQSIQVTHVNRFGGSKSSDDLMECIDTNSKYADLADAIEQLLTPMSVTITEQIQAATQEQLLKSQPPSATPVDAGASQTEEERKNPE